MMEHRLPLGICKQAIMKYESALTDINEIMKDDDITEEQRDLFYSLSECTSSIIAAIYNQVMQEMDEDSFMNETIEMDKIDHWPEPENLLDEEI